MWSFSSIHKASCINGVTTSPNPFRFDLVGLLLIMMKTITTDLSLEAKSGGVSESDKTGERSQEE